MVRLSRLTREGRRQASRAADARLKLPVNSVLPAITGDPYEGETLTVSDGTWSNTPDTYAYIWQRDGVPIAGATDATYELTAEDAGAVITATVKATNQGVSAVATSAATEEILGHPVFSDQPTITGTAQEGETLTGDPGTHDGESATYRWLADDVAIGGETGLTLELEAAQVDAVIVFEVTATNDAGSTVAESDPTAAVIAA